MGREICRGEGVVQSDGGEEGGVLEYVTLRWCIPMNTKC